MNARGHLISCVLVALILLGSLVGFVWLMILIFDARGASLTLIAPALGLLALIVACVVAFVWSYKKYLMFVNEREDAETDPLLVAKATQHGSISNSTRQQADLDGSVSVGL